MSWRTTASVVAMRDLGRAFGANQLIAKLFSKGGYEAGYDTMLFSAIQSGDCIWDIGANVGYYTRLFAEPVGEQGTVFAFEPSPKNFLRLHETCAALPNVSLLQIGLGREDGRLMLHQGADDLGATSRINGSGAGGVTVDIRSGESLLASGDVAPPNILKIDVEGFEFEVLEGLGAHLGDEALQAVGIEVHFRILKERGLPNVPRKIETLLRDYGFAITWADSSHLLAAHRER